MFLAFCGHITVRLIKYSYIRHNINHNMVMLGRLGSTPLFGYAEDDLHAHHIAVFVPRLSFGHGRNLDSFVVEAAAETT